MALPVAIVSHDQKVMLHLILIVLTWGISWWYWEFWQHYVIPTTVGMALHHQKCHVAPNFCHVYLRNAIILLAPSDTDTGTSDIRWPKVFFTSLSLSRHKGCHGAIDNASASCDPDDSASRVIWPRRPCCTSLWSSWPKECNSTINNAVYITWWWC